MKKNIIIVGMCLLIVTIICSGCTEQSPLIKTEAFEVHEWGMFLKEYTCNNSSVLTYSPTAQYNVLKPVIYFHSLKNSTNITVTISSIKNATVIPNATLKNNQIIWNVLVKNDTITSGNGTTHPYLFYEGMINCSSAITSNISKQSNSTIYSLTNTANYTLGTVFYIYGNFGDYMTSTDDYVECAYFGDLQPGEGRTVVNTSTENIYNGTETLRIIHDSLLTKGLTEPEAQGMLAYWSPYWFSPTNFGNIGTFERVIYFIPQSVYDILLPLSVSPQPTNIVRVGMFTVT
jgi:hypothetical protein